MPSDAARREARELLEQWIHAHWPDPMRRPSLRTGTQALVEMLAPLLDERDRWKAAHAECAEDRLQRVRALEAERDRLQADLDACHHEANAAREAENTALRDAMRKANIEGGLPADHVLHTLRVWAEEMQTRKMQTREATARVEGLERALTHAVNVLEALTLRPGVHLGHQIADLRAVLAPQEEQEDG